MIDMQIQIFDNFIKVQSSNTKHDWATHWIGNIDNHTSKSQSNEDKRHVNSFANTWRATLKDEGKGLKKTLRISITTQGNVTIV